MTDTSVETGAPAASGGKRDIGIRRRRAAESRYKVYGLVAISLAVLMLATLLWSIARQGYAGFTKPVVEISYYYDPALIDPAGEFEGADEARRAEIVFTPRPSGYRASVEAAFFEAIGVDAAAADPATARAADQIYSRRARARVRQMIQDDPELLGTTATIVLPVNGNVKRYLDDPEGYRKADDLPNGMSIEMFDLVDQLVDSGAIEMQFNWEFLTQPFSSNAETVGLGSSLIGSAYMMLIVLVVAVPIGVAASIYLEEFAPKNRLTDMIEVNINNLAAVPSIVFGLLGLAVFINFAGLPRSAPIVGGLVLSLMTLPTIIIATRAALKAVPPSIREAALGVGASKTQSVFHHVLPLALPGILTGTIIGLAQALGETAPLIVIGMSASVGGAEAIPATPFDPAPALPTQIYMMSDRAEVDLWYPLASSAIIVLLMFLVIMNLTAVFLRRRFERKW